MRKIPEEYEDNMINQFLDLSYPKKYIKLY